RSPITMWNGMLPELEFPGVFDSSDPRRLVVSFDGFRARVHAQHHASSTIELRPETVFSALIRGTNCWPLATNQVAFWEFATPLGGVVFFSLGLILNKASGVGKQAAMKPSARLAGLLVPGGLVEGLVWLYRGGSPRPALIGLGIALTALGCCC